MHTGFAEVSPGPTLEDEVRAMLVSALEEEVALLNGLRSVFVAQREAVGTGDPHALDDGVFAATRVMRTMDEARRRRRRLTTTLVGSELDGDDLDALLAGSANRPVRAALEGVRVAARSLREEVALLRGILKASLADNRRYLDTLVGGGGERGPTEGYPAPAPTESAAGTLLDRVV